MNGQFQTPIGRCCPIGKQPYRWNAGSGTTNWDASGALSLHVTQYSSTTTPAVSDGPATGSCCDPVTQCAFPPGPNNCPNAGSVIDFNYTYICETDPNSNRGLVFGCSDAATALDGTKLLNNNNYCCSIHSSAFTSGGRTVAPGSRRFGLSTGVEKAEVDTGSYNACNDMSDNNCNGRADYDGRSINAPGGYLPQGESTCPVGVTSLTINGRSSPTTITSAECSTNITISCSSSIGGIRSIGASLTSATCSPVQNKGWYDGDGDGAADEYDFTCTRPPTSGTPHTAQCYVNTAISTAIVGQATISGQATVTCLNRQIGRSIREVTGNIADSDQNGTSWTQIKDNGLYTNLACNPANQCQTSAGSCTNLNTPYPVLGGNTQWVCSNPTGSPAEFVCNSSISQHVGVVMQPANLCCSTGGRWITPDSTCCATDSYCNNQCSNDPDCVYVGENTGGLPQMETWKALREPYNTIPTRAPSLTCDTSVNCTPFVNNGDSEANRCYDLGTISNWEGNSGGGKKLGQNICGVDSSNKPAWFACNASAVTGSGAVAYGRIYPGTNWCCVDDHAGPALDRFVDRYSALGLSQCCIANGICDVECGGDPDCDVKLKVNGTVVDAKTNTVLTTTALYAKNSTGYTFTPTIANGWFTFDQIRAGIYTFFASVPEYYDGTYEDYGLDENSTITIKLNPYQCDDECTFGADGVCAFNRCLGNGACSYSNIDAASDAQRDDIIEACEGAPIGARRDLPSGDTVTCCMGPVDTAATFQEALTIQSCAKQLIPHTTLVQYNGKIHRLVVLSYRKCG